MANLGSQSRSSPRNGLLALAVVLAVLGGQPALAQQAPGSPAGTPTDVDVEEQGVLVDNLHAAPGRSLSQGQNTQPIGPLGLKTYRLEEVSLSEPVEVDIAGQSTLVTTALRLSVSGGPFQVRDMPYTIWIDGTLLGPGQESPDLSELSIVTFDPTVLRNGSTIAVSDSFDFARRTELPETLRVNSAP